MTDTERLDWLEGRAFTVYNSRDPENNKLGFPVVVDEDRVGSRVGNVKKTLREALDAAMESDKCNVVRREGPK